MGWLPERGVEAVEAEVDTEHAGGQNGRGSDAGREADDEHGLADVAVKEVAAGLNLVLVLANPLGPAGVAHGEAGRKVGNNVADKDAPEGGLKGGHIAHHAF